MEDIYEGTDETKIEIVLKNNGKEIWPKGNTKLIFEKNSKFIGEEISLEPQNPGEEKKYYALFKNLGKYPPGEYKSYLSFYADNNIIGEQLTLRINIKKKDNEAKEINENYDKIKEFRELFTLNEEEFSDEKIFEILKENNFDFYKSFDLLFN